MQKKDAPLLQKSSLPPLNPLRARNGTFSHKAKKRNKQWRASGSPTTLKKGKKLSKTRKNGIEQAPPPSWFGVSVIEPMVTDGNGSSIFIDLLLLLLLPVLEFFFSRGISILGPKVERATVAPALSSWSWSHQKKWQYMKVTTTFVLCGVLCCCVDAFDSINAPITGGLLAVVILKNSGLDQILTEDVSLKFRSGATATEFVSWKSKTAMLAKRVSGDGLPTWMRMILHRVWEVQSGRCNRGPDNSYHRSCHHSFFKDHPNSDFFFWPSESEWRNWIWKV